MFGTWWWVRAGPGWGHGDGPFPMPTKPPPPRSSRCCGPLPGLSLQTAFNADSGLLTRFLAGMWFVFSVAFYCHSELRDCLEGRREVSLFRSNSAIVWLLSVLVVIFLQSTTEQEQRPLCFAISDFIRESVQPFPIPGSWMYKVRHYACATPQIPLSSSPSSLPS